MKTTITRLFYIYFLLNLSFSAAAQNIVIADTCKTWSVTAGSLVTGVSSFDNHIISFKGDTVIDTVKYKQLWTEIVSPDNYNGNFYLGALREDTINSRVFFRYPNEEEKLIYDFSININDTFSIRRVDIGDYPYHIYKNYTVQSIDSVNIIGNQHKRIMFDSVYDSLRYSFEKPEIWIEGIGSLRGIVTLENPYPYLPHNEYELLCVKECDSTLFLNTDQRFGDGDCFFAAHIYYGGLKEDQAEDLLIYPNPCSEIISIQGFFDINKIVIKNLNGQNVMSIDKPNNKINIQTLLPGVYFIEVFSDKKQFCTKKFIKY